MTVQTTDTKQRIIEAASRAMIDKSYNGVGLNEILQAAGVPKGSFYHFFKSKENLGIAVVEKASAEHQQLLREFYSDRSKTPLARLRGFFEWVRDEAASRDPKKECVICKLALEQASLSEPMRAAIRCSFEQSRAMTAQVIREAQSEGEISRDFDADQLAEYLGISFEGAIMDAHVSEGARPLDTFLNMTFNVLLKRAN